MEIKFQPMESLHRVTGILDESMLTGESDAVHKAQKDRVIGGTILLDGNLKIKAIKVGKETVLSQIIEMVKKAQNNKPNVQQLGDKGKCHICPNCFNYFYIHLFCFTFGF